VIDTANRSNGNTNTLSFILTSIRMNTLRRLRYIGNTHGMVSNDINLT